MPSHTESATVFEAQRGRLFAVAYRMLGSATDAEDVLQDAFLRWNTADQAQIASAAAWLTRVVTNLCLTELTSARARWERYVGPWLPEPVLTDASANGPAETTERGELVSMAMLTLLERLSPVDRGVFVLRAAFGHSYREIAGIFDLTEANARQIYRRAAQRLKGAPRTAVPAEQREKITDRFLAAAGDGDIAGLERLLAEDVVAWTDGGGRVSAARRPVLGRAKVARYLAGSLSPRSSGTGRGRALLATAEIALAEVNGEPAVLARRGARVLGIMVLEIVGGRVTAIRTVANPDKLTFVARQLSRS